MNSYLSLTKTFISALSMSKSNDKKRKLIILILSIFALFGIMIPGALLLGFFVGISTYNLTILNAGSQISTFVLQLVLEVIAIFTFVFGISVILNELYFTNDIEYILPWPLRIWQIVISKFTAAYIGENIMQLAFIVATIVGFGIGANIGIINWFIGICGIFLLPILPMVYCTIICMLVMRFTKIIKNKDSVQKATIFIIFAILIIVLLSVSSLGNFDFNNFSGNVNELSNNYFYVLNILFPTVDLFVKAIGNGDIIMFLIYLLVNILAIIIMLVIAELIYFRGVINLSVNKNSLDVSLDKLIKSVRQHTPAYSYFMKELRILVRTPAFYTHCVIVNFIWPIFVYAVFKASDSSITLLWLKENYYANENIALFMTVFIVGISAFLTSLNSITSNAISREGKHFHFMKSIPLDYKTQLTVKTLVGILFSFIGIMVYFIPVCIFINVNIIHMIGYIILSFLTIMFVAYMGIYIDSLQPKLVWDDELSVLRENYNMFFSMAIVIVFVIVFAIGGYFILLNKHLVFGQLFLIFVSILILCNIAMYLISRKSLVNNIIVQEEM